MERIVYPNAPGRQAVIAAIVPGASFITTPDYAGYNEQQLLELTTVDNDPDLEVLASNNPANPVVGRHTVTDGSGSLITRRVQSVIIDRVRGVLDAIAAANDAPTRAAALDDAEDVLTDLLANVEQRPVDPGFPE